MALPPDFETLPEAVVAPSRRAMPQIIWLIPVVVALIGAWLAVNALHERGPNATIAFRTAEGLEPGKTRIRYRDVDIGLVKDVAISPDRGHVIVTAQFSRQAEAFLVADTRFWVVRPRFSGGQLSGAGTLLSGAYIGIDAGKSTEPKFDFTGLEVPPILTSSLPGRQFLLRADNLGSIDIGSPVYFRRIQVGQVVAYELDKDGSGVSLKVFVHAPYDRYVMAHTRFWNASGIDFSLDATGVRVQTQSMLSVLLGGIAFEAMSDAESGASSAENSIFTLHRDRAIAMKAPDGEVLNFVLYFKESLRGLVPGAPVEFRGIPVGEVLSTGLEYEPGKEWFHFPVRISLYPERIRLRVEDGMPAENAAAKVKRGLLKAMVERGFRAQLRTGSLLTGQLYVALDFFPDAKKSKVNWGKEPYELPTVRGSFEDLQVSLGKILKSIERVPFDQLGEDLRKTLQGIGKLTQQVDKEVAPQVSATLVEMRKALATVDRALAADAPLQQDLREALNELARAAQAVRSLADTLDRQPEALISGKKEGQP